MQIEKLSDSWLFERHSQETIREWLRQLRYFYFKRAWGGHANDGDEFQVAFLYTDRQDLIHKLQQLGVPVNTKLPDVEQLGHSIVFGQKVFIWINEHSIQMTISGTKDDNRYEVTQDDFTVCLELEKHFEKLGWQNIIDTSLEKSVCCISKTKYPELY